MRDGTQEVRRWDWVTFAVAKDADWNKVASEMLCCLRRDHSQQQLARLLGYRSNVASNWECGRRLPTAQRTLALCERLGVDVLWGLTWFAPRCAASLGGTTAMQLRLAAWLDALRGDVSHASLARSSGLSRHAVGRLLRGTTRPRLPQFLQLVEAATGRAYELICALVPGSAGAHVDGLKALRQAVWRGIG